MVSAAEFHEQFVAGVRGSEIRAGRWHRHADSKRISLLANAGNNGNIDHHLAIDHQRAESAGRFFFFDEDVRRAGGTGLCE